MEDDEVMTRLLRQDFSTMTQEQLLEHIEFLTRKIFEEQQLKQQLQFTVQQLQEDVQLLTQKVNELSFSKQQRATKK
jgi:hypothetical protein